MNEEPSPTRPAPPRGQLLSHGASFWGWSSKNDFRDKPEIAPLCISCASFNGINQRDICLRHSRFDRVRGEVTTPASAHRERSKSWFGADRCGPGGQYYREQTPMTPPTGGSAVRKPPPAGED